MSAQSSGSGRGRKPEVFTPDHPDLKVSEAAVAADAPPDIGAPERGPLGSGLSRADFGRGFRWGALLFAAGGLLASLALMLWFARFVTVAIERQDWIGWTAFGLLSLMAMALLMILGREVVGFWRMRRLGALKLDVDRALSTRDLALERKAIDRILQPLEARPELRWSLARVAEHKRDVRDPGDLIRLADREVMATLDGDARRRVGAAARRVSVVSALSPTALLTVGWVLVENMRLLRGLAGIYGGRPGFFGTAKLARMVFVHIIATGGVAMTDDLLGQFLGQDLLRRVSRRLGESVFNAALTARIGATAMHVIRPVPFLETEPARARDFIAEIARRPSGEEDVEATKPPRKA